MKVANPAVTIAFDTDSATAADRRTALYAEAAREQYILAVAHISFPGLGRVMSNGNNGYVWLPVNYSPVK